MRVPYMASIMLALSACAGSTPRPAPASTLPDQEDAGPARPATGPASATPPRVPADAGAEASADAATPCPAPDHGPHCLWLPTSPPNAIRARLVAKRLVADGYDAVADNDRVIVHADDASLAKLFDAAVPHELRAASATNRMLCVAVLPHGTTLPLRYRGLVAPPVLDDPACEL